MTRTLMLCLAVILMANPAFCSERRGFVLGFDIGPSLSYLHGEDSEGSSYDETNLGMGFDFRIGWAPD